MHFEGNRYGEPKVAKIEQTPLGLECVVENYDGQHPGVLVTLRPKKPEGVTIVSISGRAAGELRDDQIPERTIQMIREAVAEWKKAH